jgi:hypothetical protein
MIEQRLDRIEDMLSQLIRMVGKLSEEQQEMKIDQQEMKMDMQEMKLDQQEMKNEQLNIKLRLGEIEERSEKRHEQIIDRFQTFERDKDFIWEKTVRNEREIGNLKRLF